jgi:hypothetical protein
VDNDNTFLLLHLPTNIPKLVAMGLWQVHFLNRVGFVQSWDSSTIALVWPGGDSSIFLASQCFQP